MFMPNSFNKDWAFLASYFRLNNIQKTNKFYKKYHEQDVAKYIHKICYNRFFLLDLFGGFRLGRKFSYFQPHFAFLKKHSRSYVTEKR